MKKTVKTSSLFKFFFISIICALLTIIAVLFMHFISHINHYCEMKDLQKGSYSFESGIITIDGKKYTSDFPSTEFDHLFDYAYKGKLENEAIHIVSSDHCFVSIYRDFVVYKSIDDSNKYVLQSEPSVFDEEFLYYAVDMILPRFDKNVIQAIYITEQGCEPDNESICITEQLQISKIIKCLLSELDPTEIVDELGFDVSKDYQLWCDYFDFPMYQRIYCSVTVK